MTLYIVEKRVDGVPVAPTPGAPRTRYRATEGELYAEFDEAFPSLEYTATWEQVVAWYNQRDWYIREQTW